MGHRTRIDQKEFYIHIEMTIMRNLCGGMLVPSLRFDVDDIGEGTEEAVIRKVTKMIRSTFQCARSQKLIEDSH